MRRIILLVLLLFAVPIFAASGVGWYLMKPPQFRANDRYDFGAPLKYWDMESSHDSAAECQSSRQGLIDKGRGLLLAGADHNLMSSNEREDLERLLAMVESMRCIASNDPRLK